MAAFAQVIYLRFAQTYHALTLVDVPAENVSRLVAADVFQHSLAASVPTVPGRRRNFGVDRIQYSIGRDMRDKNINSAEAAQYVFNLLRIP